MKKCPLCNGIGYVNFNPEKLEIIKLRKKGLTIRQIAKILKKGSTTIHYHLHKNNP